MRNLRPAFVSPPSALNFLLQGPSGEWRQRAGRTASRTHPPLVSLPAPWSPDPERSWSQLPPPHRASMTLLGKGLPPLSPPGGTLPAERKISPTNYKSATRVRNGVRLFPHLKITMHTSSGTPHLWKFPPHQPATLPEQLPVPQPLPRGHPGSSPWPCPASALHLPAGAGAGGA